MPRPGVPPPREGGPEERVDTFVPPVELDVPEEELLERVMPKRGRRSAFEREAEENPRQRNMSPWRTWRCLDIDGVETDHPEYEFISPIGGHPRCPKCRSPYAMPVEAYEINRKQMLDKIQPDW